MFSWVASWFANPSGLWALIFLLPLIAVYLIKPKPTRQTVPSLMFLMRDRDKKRFNALFQALVREFLFFLHVLALLGLIAAFAQPFLSVPGTQAATDTVIVLDDSAALYATEDGRERWREAQELALDSVGRSNTIILAGTIPRAGVEGVSADRARAFLREWRPSHQPVRLSSSILAAQEFVQPGGRVVVISTFQDADTDTDYRQALATLRTQGVDVSIRQVGTPGALANNVGIVDVVVRESETRVELQNYFFEERVVSACVEQSCTEITIDARGVADWRFATPPGITRIHINSEDSFSLDNEALIVTDTRRVVRTLVVTNSDFYDSYLFFALRSIDQSTPLSFEFEINTPPQLVDITHDLVIFYDVDPQLLVGRTVREAAGRAAAGGAVIIMSQDGLFGLGYDELLPVSFQDVGGASVVVNAQNAVSLSQIDYGFTPSYFVVSEQRPLQALARAADDSAVITLSRLGQGRVLYYGLPEDASFSLDPLYPVFWRNAINLLLDRRGAESLNFPTGELIAVSQATTPSGRQVSGNVLLTTKGLYQTDQGAIAANLLSPRASDTSIPVLDQSTVDGFAREISFTQQDMSRYVVLFVILILLFEVWYLKWRGDA